MLQNYRVLTITVGLLSFLILSTATAQFLGTDDPSTDIFQIRNDIDENILRISADGHLIHTGRLYQNEANIVLETTQKYWSVCDENDNVVVALCYNSGDIHSTGAIKDINEAPDNDLIIQIEYPLTPSTPVLRITKSGDILVTPYLDPATGNKYLAFIGPGDPMIFTPPLDPEPFDYWNAGLGLALGESVLIPQPHFQARLYSGDDCDIFGGDDVSYKSWRRQFDRNKSTLYDYEFKQGSRTRQYEGMWNNIEYLEGPDMNQDNWVHEVYMIVDYGNHPYRDAALEPDALLTATPTGIDVDFNWSDSIKSASGGLTVSYGEAKSESVSKVFDNLVDRPGFYEISMTMSESGTWTYNGFTFNGANANYLQNIAVPPYYDEWPACEAGAGYSDDPASTVETGIYFYDAYFDHPKNIPRRVSDPPVNLGVCITPTQTPGIEKATLTLKIWDPREPEFSVKEFAVSGIAGFSVEWNGQFSNGKYCKASDIMMKLSINWEMPVPGSEEEEPWMWEQADDIYEPDCYVADLRVWTGKANLNFKPDGTGPLLSVDSAQEVLEDDITACEVCGLDLHLLPDIAAPLKITEPYMLAREYPGTYLPVNWDCDYYTIAESYEEQGSGGQFAVVPDYLRTGVNENEDNLAKIMPKVLDKVGELPDSGIVRLNVSQSDHINFFSGYDKTQFLTPVNGEFTWDLSIPANRVLLGYGMWMEGVAESEVEADKEFRLTYERDGEIISEDTAKATVVMIHSGNTTYRQNRFPPIEDRGHAALYLGYTGLLSKSRIYSADCLGEGFGHKILQMSSLNAPPSVDPLNDSLYKDGKVFFGVHARYPSLNDGERLRVLRNAHYIAKEGILGDNMLGIHYTYLAVELDASFTPTPPTGVALPKHRLDNLDKIRCDGLVEVAYEASDISVWTNRYANWNVFMSPQSHNDNDYDLFSTEWDRYLSPITQAGSHSVYDRYRGTYWDTTLERSSPLVTGIITPLPSY